MPDRRSVAIDWSLPAREVALAVPAVAAALAVADVAAVDVATAAGDAAAAVGVVQRH